MALLAFGINHRTAPVNLRERAAISPEQVISALREARTAAGLHELAVLSTCNRTEFYGVAEPDAAEALRDWLAEARGIDADALRAVWYCHEDAEAVRHAMRVAAGLDSMVLGEPQILGQMKAAHADAHAAGTLGSGLEQLFQSTFNAAKQVRTETAIGASPVSIAFAAVTLARQVFASLAQAPVLLVGAGEMNTLVARHLREQGVGSLMIANRTPARAEALAAETGARVIDWARLDDALAEADMVVSCTASPVPVITRDAVRRALARRRHRPLLLIDIAVPRDIEPAVADLDDTFLYSVDDLQSVVDAGWRNRQAAAEAAEHLIAQQVVQFSARLRIQQEGVRRIRHLREQTLAMAEAERARALAALARGEAAETVLSRLEHALLNKWLHAPTVALRELAATGDDAGLQRLAEQLDARRHGRGRRS